MRGKIWRTIRRTINADVAHNYPNKPTESACKYLIQLRAGSYCHFRKPSLYPSELRGHMARRFVAGRCLNEC
jgi:hypothetical protein